MSKDASIITCQKCGEPLEAGWDRCPACLTPTSSGGLTCPNCQSPIKENWKLCPHCKTTLPGWKTPPASGISATEKKSDSSQSQVFVTIVENEPVATVGFGVELPIIKGDVLCDRYQIIQSLGAGGFGAVYQVDDLVLNEQMALKIVVAGKGKAQRATEQILHEFKLRERINDTTHIVKAQDPRPCEYKGLSLVLLPMEFADSRSMRQWLAQNQDVEKRQKKGLELFEQTCLGIKAIHDAGLVHLDIKPDNILLLNGKAKIADFGIGRYGACQFTKNPGQLLRQGIGTPQYMSPEQFHVARQKDVGPGSDIYSLGIVLFELLDGNLPFDGTPIELRDKHLNMLPPYLTGKPGRWWGIVKRCMEKKVEDRYQNVKQLIKDLERARQGTALSIDVSCPECGHINANPAARECDKCRTNLASLFRLCPICDKSVRLDIEKCPVCGKGVAAYYRLLERKEQIEKLKDEDPVEAIELLETVLQGDAEDFQERAIQLLKDLRKKQSQISSLTAKAREAEAACLPEQAIEIWHEVLRIIPRHRTAMEPIQKLESLMKDFHERLERTTSLMDEAMFENADKLLQNCLELIPTREDIKKMLKICRQRARDYTIAFQQASLSTRHKQIQKANKQINQALLQAPNSGEALTLADKIHKALEKTSKLLYQAKLQLNQAEFFEADKIIQKIKQFQTDGDAVLKLKEELVRAQNLYAELIETARTAINSHDLNGTPEIIEKAIKLCPEASEAHSLLEQVKNKQEEAHNLIEKAISVKAAAKFDEAEAFLGQVEEFWSTMDLLENSREKFKNTQAKYDGHINQAHQARTAKDLEKALEESQLALTTCPASGEAESLLQQIKQEKGSDLLTQVGYVISAAKFEEAKVLLTQAKKVWPTLGGFDEVEITLTETSAKYNKHMKRARLAKVLMRLKRATKEIMVAQELCPHSREAGKLKDSIETAQIKRNEKKQRARYRTAKITKWTIFLIPTTIGICWNSIANRRSKVRKACAKKVKIIPPVQEICPEPKPRPESADISECDAKIAEVKPEKAKGFIALIVGIVKCIFIRIPRFVTLKLFLCVRFVIVGIWRGIVAIVKCVFFQVPRFVALKLFFSVRFVIVGIWRGIVAIIKCVFIQIPKFIGRVVWARGIPFIATFVILAAFFVIFRYEQKVKVIESLISKAQTFKSKGQLSESLGCITEALTLNPDNIKAEQLKVELMTLLSEKQKLETYRKAAEAGNSEAMSKLGLMYDVGKGVAIDDREAVKWYRKAADAGNSNAMNDLGVMYRNGRGVTKDNKKAIYWYRKAAQQGNKIAQRNLADLGETW